MIFVNKSELIQKVLNSAKECSVRGEKFRLLVSGGSSIEPILSHLSEVLRPEGTEVFLADERVVPLGSSDSNSTQVRKLLGGAFSVKDFYKDGLPDPECGEVLFQELDKLDFAILGVGEDGHICSLFPGQDFENDCRLVKKITDSPKPPTERVTVTFSLLKKSTEGALLIFGPSKRHLLELKNYTLPYVKALKDLNFFCCTDDDYLEQK